MNHKKITLVGLILLAATACSSRRVSIITPASQPLSSLVKQPFFCNFL